MLTRQTPLVGTGPHGHADFRGKHILIAARQRLQQAANHFLTSPDAVYIGTVKIEQPVLQCCLKNRACIVFTESPITLMSTPGQAEIHRTEAQLGDEQATVFA